MSGLDTVITHALPPFELELPLCVKSVFVWTSVRIDWSLCASPVRVSPSEGYFKFKLVSSWPQNYIEVGTKNYADRSLPFAALKLYSRRAKAKVKVKAIWIALGQ